MNKITIFNETTEPLQSLLSTVKHILKYASKKEKLKNIEFSVIIVDDDIIQKLNRDYRKINKVTDVITFALEDENSFPIDSSRRLLGDIYISIDKAKQQAEEYKHSLKRELCFLSIHGFYHLLGYDHQNKEDEEIMFSKQEEVLSKYGIQR